MTVMYKHGGSEVIWILPSISDRETTSHRRNINQNREEMHKLSLGSSDVA